MQAHERSYFYFVTKSSVDKERSMTEDDNTELGPLGVSNKASAEIGWESIQVQVADEVSQTIEAAKSDEPEDQPSTAAERSRFTKNSWEITPSHPYNVEQAIKLFGSSVVESIHEGLRS